MMKIFYTYLLLVCIVTLNVNAQTAYNYIQLRGKNSHLNIAFTSKKEIQEDKKFDFKSKDIAEEDIYKQHKTWTYKVYNSYGELKVSSENQSQNRYSYQGQEFDQNLGISLFPSRTYSSSEKRFQQPDPVSQYFSPYLFVNADPVNYVDRNGQEGHRPLVLYQENHDYLDGVSPATLDLKAAVPDAHYVPMSDFINGRVGDLPDWNGNVFLRGHIGSITPGRELVAETGIDMSKFKTTSSEGILGPEYIKGYATNVTTVSGERMGKELRRFSEARGVPIKHITEGSCIGAYANKKVHQGFMEESKKLGIHSKKTKVKFRGPSQEYEVRITGENVFKDLKIFGGPQEARLYLTPGIGAGVPFRTRNFRKEFVGYTHTLDGQKYVPDFFIGEKDLRGVMNGKFTRKAKRLFKKITDFY